LFCVGHAERIQKTKMHTKLSGKLISYTYVYKQSKHSCIFWYELSVAFVIYCCLILTTCFNPFTGPSSGLQLYKLWWSLLLAVTPTTACIVSYKKSWPVYILNLFYNSSNEISLLKCKKHKRLTKVHIKSYTSKTVNGYPNRNCNRQNSVGITSKLLARYPGTFFLGAYVQKMLLLFCAVPYASGTEFVLECSFCNDLLG
jgi:hypothetical protein